MAFIAQHMQHRAEHFAIQHVDGGDLDDRRGDEKPGKRRFSEIRRINREAALTHRRDMAVHPVARLGADQRADIGAEPVRGAHVQNSAIAPREHRHQPGRDFILHQQNAQGRAALPGGIEGGGDDIGHRLLRQSGGIDDHRILSAGFGDQRDRYAVFIDRVRSTAAGWHGPPPWSR